VARRLAEFIIESPNRVIETSITELAETAGVSEGSVVSLCRQAGARGFQQLKIVLARELVTDLQFIHEDLDAEDDTARIIGKIFQSNVECIQATQQSLDLGAMERAAQAIKAAQRVEVYGIGSATPIALDAQYRLLRIGIQATAQVDSHVQAISASRTDKNVAVISISHSGSTTETLAATRLAHEAGATTIAITSAARSPITRYADIVLNTVARETRFRTEAMTSRIAQLAIVDGLISLVAMADQERATQTLRATFDVLSIKRL
jgi:RpiR family transcriptional regulator, carbohydrate utilization regulator